MNPCEDDRYPLTGLIVVLCWVLALVNAAGAVVLVVYGAAGGGWGLVGVAVAGIAGAIGLVGLAEALTMIRDAATNSWHLRSTTGRIQYEHAVDRGHEPESVRAIDDEIVQAVGEAKLAAGTTSVACEFCGAVLKVPIGTTKASGRCPACRHEVKLR